MHEDGRTSTEDGTDTDQISLYVYEFETDELVDAIYDAESVVIPDVGDRVSFVEARADGDLDTESVSYQERSDGETYVVRQREITYISVDYDIDGLQQSDALVSEVKLWVSTEYADREPGRTAQ
ncbi:hypothetical protein [Natrialba asiatica]|uniref:Uncharacterized protein n=1 Tax=Natrialba asiatica (strain ATCC 700177 / DSM 12278 / JCM 9576 / FERM P-10747 / NBRC 102637 / 172P1) TaxID=29540 RepID=M0B1Q3_NATA1|nr:hypothetical protein [Natrialba asiatica]ELZ04710.1 hypothetical protein C481_04171 [Natrialba asiatica DSM 12278]